MGSLTINKSVDTDDVIAVIYAFCKLNHGDIGTLDMILAIGAEILGVPIEDMCSLIEHRISNRG